MARPRTARLATAYDLGHEHGRTGHRPAGADDVIGDDPNMQQAYDDGLADGTDSLDPPPPPRPRAHRAKPTQQPRPRAGKTKPAGDKPHAGKSSDHRQRFSHPMRWGTGARGHVVGRPRLTPPRRVTVSDGTGFLFGVFLYAMALNWVRYGPQGLTSWLSAKFLNRPTLTPSQAAKLTPKASDPKGASR